MMIQTPGTIAPAVMPSVTTLPVMPVDMTPHPLPDVTAPTIERPDEFIYSPMKRLGMLLVTISAPLIFATGCDFFKKTKQDEPQAVSLTSDAAVKGTIPRAAYVIGKSRSLKLPANGRLPQWRITQLKNQAKKKAYTSLDTELRNFIFSKTGGCAKSKIYRDIIKTEHKKVLSNDPQGVRQIHYEFWILWKRAYCYGYEGRMRYRSEIGNIFLPKEVKNNAPARPGR